jgi:hypothetical protein
MKKSNIALMCKSHDYQLVDQSTNTFKTSSWQMSKKKAVSLVGETVTLTESSKKAAYMGGKIIDVIPVEGGNRFDIIFNAEKTMAGNKDSINHPGWGNGRAVCYI